MSNYDEEYMLEHALYPWLDDGSMESEPEPDYDNMRPIDDDEGEPESEEGEP